MKYFKKFLLLGIFTLLGVSFCSSYSYTITGTYSNSNISQYSSSLFMFPVFPYNGYYDLSYSCLFSNVVYDIENVSSVPAMNMSINYQLAGSSNGITQQTNVETFSILSGLVSGTFSLRNNNTPPSHFNYINFYKSAGAVPGGLAFDYSCEFTYDVGDISTCDYSEYESQISTLQSQLNTATGSLATCQSNLNTATGNLASCQSDLTSCQSQLPNGGSCSVSAYNSIAYSGQVSLSANSTSNAIDFGSSPNKTLCVTLSGNLGNNNYVKIGFYGNTSSVASDSQEYRYDQVGKTVCMYANKRYFNINNPKATSPTISYEAYFLNDLLDKSVPCLSGSLGYTQAQCESEYDLISISSVNSQYCVNNGLCPSCPDQYTSLQCQEEYNLIPINDINENYCTLNFDLISPSDCPSSPSGSGTSRSALYVNNVQYLGSPSIYVNIPEIIDWRYTYNSGNMILDVEGYNVDTGYMADILTVQEYHPSSEDFTVAFVSFLTFVLPYVIVTLFVIFVRKLLRKIFKS